MKKTKNYIPKNCIVESKEVIDKTSISIVKKCKSRILLTKKNDPEFKELWTVLTLLCKSHNSNNELSGDVFPYYTLNKLKYPFEFDDYIFEIVPVNCKKQS